MIQLVVDKLTAEISELQCPRLREIKRLHGQESVANPKIRRFYCTTRCLAAAAGHRRGGGATRFQAKHIHQISRWHHVQFWSGRESSVSGIDWYKKMETVYAFILQGYDKSGNRILKVGRTRDWEKTKREKGYNGTDRPDYDEPHLFRETPNSFLLEKSLKRILCEFFRLYYGKERFLVPANQIPKIPQIMQMIEKMIDVHPLDPAICGMQQHEVLAFKRKLCENENLESDSLAYENAMLRNHISENSTSFVDKTKALNIPSMYDIGSDKWKNLSEDDRQKSVEALSVVLNLQGGVPRNGVPEMLRIYFTMIAPLERLPFKRGHRWRDSRLVGQRLMQSWSNLLTRMYEPILCRVIEYMDANEGMAIWAAADAIDEVRISLGTFDKLAKTEEIKKFDKAARDPYLARLLDMDFATAALASYATI